jgi:hypothetical protein
MKIRPVLSCGYEVNQRRFAFVLENFVGFHCVFCVLCFVANLYKTDCTVLSTLLLLYACISFSMSNTELSERQLEGFKRAFSIFDKNESGSITVQ